MSKVQISPVDINSALKVFAPGCTFENGVFSWKNETIDVKLTDIKANTQAIVAVSGLTVSASSVQFTKDGASAEFTVG